MNTVKKILTVTLTILVLYGLSSCEQKITIESVVHPDGAIDRTIQFTEVDSTKINRNILGVSQEKGWETKVERIQSDSSENKNGDYTITFRKSFSSVEEMNHIQDAPQDTLFRITSSFEKKFRWFYTYLYYADTYKAVNRFRHLPMEDHFTQEDFTFINRLPEEGKSITKADSITLDHLNQKLENYFTQALYEEHFMLILEAVRKNNLESRWTDSLTSHKKHMYTSLMEKEDDNLLEEAFMIQLIDSLAIGFPLESIREDYTKLFKSMNPRIKFMTEVASEAKFNHSIKMPWSVVATNADSINDNSLYWRPVTLKFLLHDYTMYAEARTLNYWTLVVSGIIVILTIAVFWKRRSG